MSLMIELTIAILVITSVGTGIMIYNWIARIKEKAYSDGLREGQQAVGISGFLSKNETIIPPSQHITKQIEAVKKAKKYIKILVVDGGNWLPSLYDELKKKAEDCKIYILFLNPNSNVNQYLYEKELRLTKDPSYVSLIIDSKVRSERIKKNYDKFKEIAKIKFYNEYPFWRGMIIDGEYAIYSIVYAPFFGWEAAQRETNNNEIVKHFEQYYFDKIWKSSLDEFNIT